MQNVIHDFLTLRTSRFISNPPGDLHLAPLLNGPGVIEVPTVCHELRLCIVHTEIREPQVGREKAILITRLGIIPNGTPAIARREIDDICLTA